MVLGYSRVQWACFVDGMDMVRFLECHRRAFEYFGGVPQTGLYDNCKTVVSDRVGSQVQFNQDFMRFACHYGYQPDACWMGDPESKGKVESSIGYTEQDFLYTQPLDEMEFNRLNEALWRWLDEVANQRIHQTTDERPADRLAEEKDALGGLPERSIPIFDSIERRVRKDALFSFENNEYSVPHEYARSRVVIQVYRDRLEVYSGTERIAEHERFHEGGMLVKDDEHWEDRPTGDRKRKDALQKEFEAMGDVAPSFLKNLARQRNGHLREQVEGILELREDYEDERIHEAMVRADEFGKYSHGTVKRILEQTDRHPDGLVEDPRERDPGGQYTGPEMDVSRRSLEEYGDLAEVNGS
jgi:hypothetical protein